MGYVERFGILKDIRKCCLPKRVAIQLKDFIIESRGHEVIESDFDVFSFNLLQKYIDIKRAQVFDFKLDDTFKQVVDLEIKQKLFTLEDHETGTIHTHSLCEYLGKAFLISSEYNRPFSNFIMSIVIED